MKGQIGASVSASLTGSTFKRVQRIPGTGKGACARLGPPINSSLLSLRRQSRAQIVGASSLMGRRPRNAPLLGLGLRLASANQSGQAQAESGEGRRFRNGRREATVAENLVVAVIA